MFRKLLVANRGEIAVRIFQACRELGIRTVAVYSDADRRAMHVDRADEAVRLGPASAAESYLNRAALLRAAMASGADAIHPGYGFLSENADFAEACRDAGFVFVGPSVAAMRSMADKSMAREIARRAGVPVVEGYDGENQHDSRLAAEAQRIGYPVLIKAAMGGGGKGMRPVLRASDFGTELERARNEARLAFGDDRVLLERLLSGPRHVEVQVLGDEHGRLIALGERDCSIQRRHQKVMEESPSPALDPAARSRLCDLALRLARSVGYTNAGTVEFLLDGDGSVYFLEMNTRLQVEHAITEVVYAVDLVRLQLELAAGSPLPSAQPLEPRGHAIECRVYAEDPAGGFLPSTGRVLAFELPEGSGVRNDPGVRAGDSIGPYYDPLLAKLTVWGPDRAAAVERMGSALAQYVVLGLRTNLSLLRAIVAGSPFRRGEIDIGYLERSLPDLVKQATPSESVFCAASVAELRRFPEAGARPSPWQSLGPWRTNGQGLHLRWSCDGLDREVQADRQAGEPVLWRLDCRGQTYLADAEPADAERERGGLVRLESAAGVEQFQTAIDGVDVWVGSASGVWRLSPPAPAPARPRGDARRRGEMLSLVAPMPGIVTKISVHVGETVEAHQVLLTLEAMKMEHAVEATTRGSVARINCHEGELVAAGATLIELAP